MISRTELISLIDLTSLNTTDYSGSIDQLIDKANLSVKNNPIASVCVYPKFANQLKTKLDPSIKTCAVSTYFPSSQAPLEIKLEEIKYLNKIGIDEIDIVLPIGDFLAKKYTAVENELSAIRKQTNSVIKLIIETSILQEQALIEKATEMAIHTGMDFVKTSTGKAATGADIRSASTIAKTLQKSNSSVGLKIAGGIKSEKEALQYVKVVAAILGSQFISPATFRIGASTLYNHLILE